MAKFSFEVMQECVYPFTVKESKDPDVILVQPSAKTLLLREWETICCSHMSTPLSVP